MRLVLKAGLLIAFLGVIQACMGVPLQTLFFFKNFTVDDFLAANPHGVRAATCVDARIRFESSVPSLNIALVPKEGVPVEKGVPLTILQEGRLVSSGVSEAPSGQHWYLFKLAPSGVEAMKQVQTELSSNKHLYKGMKISISAYYGQLPDDLAKRFPLDLRLQLTPDDPYVTLFKGNESFKEVP